MAVDVNATRRQRAVDALAAGASRTFSRVIDGDQYVATLASPLLRVLGDSPVFSVDMQVTRNGLVYFDDRINMPNPAQGVRDADGVYTDAPLLALRATLLDVLRSTTGGFTRPHLMRNASGDLLGDTLAVRSSTDDGSVESSSGTFATMAGGSGLTANSANANDSVKWHLFIGTYTGRMVFLGFDTSTLTSAAQISGAVYTLYANGNGNGDTNGYDAEIRHNDFGGTVSTADWFDPRSGVWSGLVSAGALDIGAYVTTSNTANNFSDSGIYSSINLTGETRVVVGLSGMDNATPTNFNSIDFRLANTAGTSTDPLLTVTYTWARTRPIIIRQSIQRAAVR